VRHQRTKLLERFEECIHKFGPVLFVIGTTLSSKSILYLPQLAMDPASPSAIVTSSKTFEPCDRVTPAIKASMATRYAIMYIRTSSRAPAKAGQYMPRDKSDMRLFILCS